MPYARRQFRRVTLDQSRKWADSTAGLDSKLEETAAQGVSKFMSALGGILEAQETVLNSAIEALNAARTGKKKPAE